ncbi:MAG: uroporphyrinogen decarboxylase family protein [Bryobacteraceae bacterium]
MTSKERLLTAIGRGVPDRLPATTHHVMAHFLKRYMGGQSIPEFFDEFGLDAITWTVPHKPDPAKGEYADPLQGEPGFLESRRIASPEWHVEFEDVPGRDRKTTRYRFVTPKGELSMVIEEDGYSAWVGEPLIKEKTDIELIGAFATAPKCDVEAVNRTVVEMGERGIVRGHICCFDVFGQPGCWQDACCLAGTQNLILAAHDDREWVHEFLRILQARKRVFIQSMQGARYDLVEFGGGDASSTVISPKMFDQFVAPYDSELIAEAHAAGQRIVYHTCGGMMPLLERIAAMGPDAMETFTPAAMGGDVDLAEAKRRIGEKVCMIGGFDQFHFFKGGTEAQTRAEVRRCFEAAGAGGGYILSPSDHFFDADPELIRAFADESRRCAY